MNLQQIKSFASLLGAKDLSVSGDWANINCPYAPWTHQSGTDSNPSFGISISPNGASHASCFSCGPHGDLYSVLLDLKEYGAELPYAELMALIDAEDEGAEIQLDPEPEFSKGRILYPESWLESFPRVQPASEAWSYLSQRGLDWTTAYELDIRWDGTRRRVCFPLRDADGRCIGLHGRSIDPDPDVPYLVYMYKNDCNRDAWLGEHWVDFDKPVVMVESVFDLAAVWPVYRNVVTPRSANPNKKQIMIMQDAFEIVLMFDGDKAGDIGMNKITAALGQNRVIKRAKVPDGLDPGKLSQDQIRDLLSAYI